MFRLSPTARGAVTLCDGAPVSPNLCLHLCKASRKAVSKAVKNRRALLVSSCQLHAEWSRISLPCRDSSIQIVPWPLENHTMGCRLADSLLTSDLEEQCAESKFAGPPRSIAERGPQGLRNRPWARLWKNVSCAPCMNAAHGHRERSSRLIRTTRAFCDDQWTP